MEHHQTVVRPHNGTQGFWATVWCVSFNFQLSIADVSNEFQIHVSVRILIVEFNQ